MRSPMQRALYLAAILFALVPFAFGLTRALSTGTDYRYFWVAFASFIGAAVVMKFGKTTSRSIVSAAFVVLIIATLVAAVTAFLVGAKSGPAVLVVALSFALCYSASCALYKMSRDQQRPQTD